MEENANDGKATVEEELRRKIMENNQCERSQWMILVLNFLSTYQYEFYCTWQTKYRDWNGNKYWFSCKYDWMRKEKNDTFLITINHFARCILLVPKPDWAPQLGRVRWNGKDVLKAYITDEWQGGFNSIYSLNTICGSLVSQDFCVKQIYLTSQICIWIHLYVFICYVEDIRGCNTNFSAVL